MLKRALGWGLALWVVGYLLGSCLFFVIPPSLIGWAITPVGTILTLWVVFTRIPAGHLRDYLTLAVS